MSDIATSLRHTMQIEAVKRMAEVLLNSEGKKLKNLSKFSIPNGLTPIPAGVYPYSPGRYALLTPDGLAEIRDGDWIVQTEENQFYFIRLETVE